MSRASHGGAQQALIRTSRYGPTARHPEATGSNPGAHEISHIDTAGDHGDRGTRDAVVDELCDGRVEHALAAQHRYLDGSHGKVRMIRPGTGLTLTGMSARTHGYQIHCRSTNCLTSG